MEVRQYGFFLGWYYYYWSSNTYFELRRYSSRRDTSYTLKSGGYNYTGVTLIADGNRHTKNTLDGDGNRHARDTLFGGGNKNNNGTLSGDGKEHTKNGCSLTTDGAVICTAIQAVFLLAICVLNRLRCEGSCKRNNGYLLLGSPKHSRLLSMTLIVFLGVAPACGTAITCTAGNFTAGDTATMTCYFPDDIVNHHMVYVQYFPASAPSGASVTGIQVLACEVEDVMSSICRGHDGYELKGHTTNTVSIALPSVTAKAEGQYVCQFLPHDGSPRDNCTLTVHGGVTPVSVDRRDSTTSTTSRPHQDDLTKLYRGIQTVIVLLSVFLVVMILVLVITLVIIRQRCPLSQRESRRRQTEED